MRDLGGVLAGAVRLLGRHWPALLTLSLLGAAWRSGLVWAAVEVSDWNAQVAQLLLILAPLGLLAALVLMLNVCRTSLPAMQGEREGRLVDVAVSVLVPFLAVYAAYGLLDGDVNRFRNLAAFQEFNRTSLGESLDYDYAGRLGVLSLQVALIVVLGAWVVRWVLGRLEGRTQIAALTFVGALVELYYTSQLAGQTIVFRTSGVDWLERRVAVTWFEDAYDWLLDHLGFLAGPFDVAVGAVSTVASSAETVVVVPVAFLAVAAVVLGQRLRDEEEPTTGEETDRRGLLTSLLADVRARFQPLVDGVRLLASGGLGPMLVICLLLVVVGQGPALVSSTARHLWGPMRTEDAIAVSPMEAVLGLALAFALTAPLLAAAVDWLTRRRAQAVTEPAAPRSPAAPTTAAPS